MNENSRDIDAIRTRHAILTVITGDILQTHNFLGNILVEIAHFLLRERLQWTIG